MDVNTPATWSQLNFGWYVALPGALVPDGVTTIRQVTAPKPAHVGGHGNCGEGLDHLTEWGEANYPARPRSTSRTSGTSPTIRVFSKYFVTFPLDAIPAGRRWSQPR
ncbi:MAG: hypothetical protein R3A10_16660 [Caldilineaceae bacterium]